MRENGGRERSEEVVPVVPGTLEEEEQKNETKEEDEKVLQKDLRNKGRRRTKRRRALSLHCLATG